MADEEEYAQLTLSEVFVYKIPPKASATGHKCVAAAEVGALAHACIQHPTHTPPNTQHPTGRPTGRSRCGWASCWW